MHRKMNYKEDKEMWAHFVEYREHIQSSPRTKVEYVGKDGDRVETPLRVPLTIEGFENYVYEKYSMNIHDYLYSKDERYIPFSTICTRIKSVIRQDQIEGGMVGQYNASITQRLNGLADKQEIEDKREPPVFEVKVKK